MSMRIVSLGNTREIPSKDPSVKFAHTFLMNKPTIPSLLRMSKMALQQQFSVLRLSHWSRLMKKSSSGSENCSFISNKFEQRRRESKYMPDDPDNPIEHDSMGVPVPRYPLRRVANFIKHDFKNMKKGVLRTPKDEIFPKYCDIVVLGGGIMGSSIAYFIKQKTGLDVEVVVVDKDPTYATSSTTLSVGGIRQQFSSPVNIQMSQFGYEFLQDIKKHLHVEGIDPPEINFWPNGYLFLASEAGAEILERNHRTQRRYNAKVELLSPEKLKEKFGWLNVDDVALGSFGYAGSGWFDPNSLLMAFKLKAINLGVQYVDANIVGFKITGIHGGDQLVERDGMPFAKINRQMRTVIVKVNGEDYTREIHAAKIVFAAGCGSGRLGELAGMGTGKGILSSGIPVEPRKRYVYIFDCPDGPGLSCPMIIDSSGTYVRKDGLGTQYICGRSPSPDEEPDASDLEVDYSYFYEKIWPVIAKRVPSFEKLKLKSAYAGYYDYNTFDQNGIVGQHPFYYNAFLATGFSGHGLQHAPAVGRAVAEMIIENRFRTIDLKSLDFLRIIDNEPVVEHEIV